MPRSLALIAVLLAGAGCRTEPGGSCTEGADDCEKNLVCFEGRCRSPRHVQVETRRRAALAAQDTAIARSREAMLQAKLLRQSGVNPPRLAEAAPDAALPAIAGPPAPGAVRVAHTHGRGRIFAACRGDERLLGGGCEVSEQNETISASHPEVAPQATDTMGARWICAARSELSRVQAYALCQSPPPPR